MKKIRMICAALTIAVVGSFGGVAMAADNVSELPAAKETPAVMQEEVAAHMLSGYAEVTELAPLEVDSAFIVVKPEDGSYPEIRLNIGADTLFVNHKTGQMVKMADIKVGDRVYVYYDMAMTRSIPPQSRAYMVLVDVKEGTPAKLWTVESFEAEENGDMVVTTDNGGLLLRIPAANWQGGVPQMKDGERFLAWYDIVALSYPGQATANKAMLLPANAAAAYDAAADEAQDKLPAVEIPAAASTITTTVTVKEIVNTADEQYILVERPDGAGDMQLNFATEGEHALLVVDAQTGVKQDLSSVQPGSQIMVNHNAAMTFSLPPQSWLNYVLVNLDENPPAGLFKIEEFDKSVDSIKTTRFLTNEGSLWITFPLEAITGDDMAHMWGLQDYVLVWYDIVLESYPAQATADKVIELTEPAEYAQKVSALEWETKYYNDMQTSKLVLGDMVFTDMLKYVSHGVPMVPLRLVAEHLGYDVSWSPSSQVANINNGKIQTSLYDGQESFNYTTAIPGAVGMSTPVSLDGMTRMMNDILYVPAELFEMLGHTVTVSGDTMTIK